MPSCPLFHRSHFLPVERALSAQGQPLALSGASSPGDTGGRHPGEGWAQPRGPGGHDASGFLAGGPFRVFLPTYPTLTRLCVDGAAFQA